MLFFMRGAAVEVFEFTDLLGIRFRIDGLGCVFAATWGVLERLKETKIMEKGVWLFSFFCVWSDKYDC